MLSRPAGMFLTATDEWRTCPLGSRSDPPDEDLPLADPVAHCDRRSGRTGDPGGERVRGHPASPDCALRTDAHAADLPVRGQRETGGDGRGFSPPGQLDRLAAAGRLDGGRWVDARGCGSRMPRLASADLGALRGPRSPGRAGASAVSKLGTRGSFRSPAASRDLGQASPSSSRRPSSAMTSSSFPVCGAENQSAYSRSSESRQSRANSSVISGSRPGAPGRSA
ncbi:hypothetical protein A4R44_04912 [Amycolatopsis sp. M39]|nr:hypothetical protein A4R44_04912 [Amycolatopsis sp. M39]